MRFSLSLFAALAVGATLPVWSSQAITGCWPTTVADAASFNPPTYEQHHVTDNFDGSVAKPTLNGQPRARQYRTAIREGAKSGPNFAGHYTIVGWGCGATCTSVAIVDARTGEVFFPPFQELVHYGFDVAPGEPEPDFWPLRFRRDSSLLVVIGEVDTKQGGIRYYHWTGHTLKLLKVVLTEKINCTP